jgi:hypothetical protein
MSGCTFIHGGSAHPREYTFDHGWARAELRAPQTVHASPYGKAVFFKGNNGWRYSYTLEHLNVLLKAPLFEANMFETS